MCSRVLWCLLPVTFLVLTPPVFAHQTVPATLWHRIDADSNAAPRFLLNHAELDRILSDAASHRPGSLDAITSAGTSTQSDCVIELPWLDGSLRTFSLVNSEVMPVDLAARYPHIKSFSGCATDDAQTIVKLTTDGEALRAQIFAPSETIHIFSPNGENGAYVSVARQSLSTDARFQCLSESPGPQDPAPRLGALGIQRGGRQLRTYRVAIASSGEFTQANGGTVAGAMAAIVSTINYVNGIYERELGIRLQLVPNNDKIIFTNPNKDPYSANLANTTTLLENQEVIDSIIGSANYDVGHLFNTAEYGLAYIGVVCRQDWKARGCVGSSTPGGNLFFADYVAHEMAHQFGANHTFNSGDGLCFAGRNPATAYEPGSGSTLMGYSGFCNNDNLQAHNNAYFHSISYDEISAFIASGSGASCAIVTNTGNNPPVVDTAPHFSIPRGTPFRLIASGHDPDGDAVTYCWEQRDLGPAQSVYDSDNGHSPLFRSLEPTSDPSRTFPKMESLLQNFRFKGEQLPSRSRGMNFRVTARDNRGGIATADTLITVTDAGPFRLRSHNSSEGYFGTQTITWDVAGTDAPPVNLTHVNILLSTNGGKDFNVVLAANTPNDGSERVLFPNDDIESARLKIEAVGNIFFAINEVPFSIRRYFAVPDFNGDQKVDLVWQNNSGQLATWFLDGTNFLRAGLLRDGIPVPPEWRLAGMSDFNDDTHVDLLWQHTSGRTAVWFMNGTNFIGSEILRNGTLGAPGWRIVCAQDMDADYKPDILWQHEDGRLAIWKMSGTSFLSSTLLRNGAGAPAWKAIGVSDFNADGQNDILFRHTDGRLAAWLMNGFDFVQGFTFNTLPVNSAWRFGAMADLDGNGQKDFIWLNTNGKISVWFMSGDSILQTGTLLNGSIGTHWRLMGPR